MNRRALLRNTLALAGVAAVGMAAEGMPAGPVLVETDEEHFQRIYMARMKEFLDALQWDPLPASQLAYVTKHTPQSGDGVSPAGSEFPHGSGGLL